MRGTAVRGGHRVPVRRLPAAVVALHLAVAASGCAARATQFSDFAQAGLAYVKASEAVIDEAGTASIKANNVTLVRTRPAIPPDKRLDEINTHNELLRQRLAILQDIRRHGRLLQTYFQALAALAGSDAPRTSAAAAESAFAALSKVSPEIKAAKTGVASLGDLVPAVTKPLVASFRHNALERELGWRPRHRLEEGLRATVRWYLEHRDWLAETAARYDGRRLGLARPQPAEARP